MSADKIEQRESTMTAREHLNHGFNAGSLRQGDAMPQHLENENIKLDVRDLKLYYGADIALKGVDLKIPEKKVTAFIGPSG